MKILNRVRVYLLRKLAGERLVLMNATLYLVEGTAIQVPACGGLIAHCCISNVGVSSQG